MVLQLIRDELGNYVYKDPKETPTPPITSQEFEAYTGGDKTTLAGTTDLGSQTQALMRETPGQTRLVTDPVTGETKLDTQITPTKVEQKDFAPPSAQELIESPLQKAARIAQQFPMQQQTGPDQDEIFNLIRDQQKLAQRSQKLDQISQVADIGFRAYNLFKGGSTGTIPGTTGTITPLRGGAFGTQSGFMAPSSAGGALAAGAIAYGVADTFKVKEKKGAAAGATIGAAVGGPIGAVIGAVGGGVVESVFCGSVICTELYKQKLMSKEDHRLSWNFTINNFSNTHINGYWYWAVPMVKLMKKNKLVTKFWNHVMSNRTKDIKWRLKKGKFNLLGRLYSMLIENGSYVVGKLISKKHKEVLA